MKAVILANGRRPGKRLLQKHLRDADIVLAVDGAAAIVRKHGIRLDALVGDLDSVQPDDLRHIEQQGIDIVRLPREKDETDTLAAFDEAIRRGADEIVLLGALGRRLDHTFANILLLVRAAQRGVRAVLEDERNTVFAATGKVTLPGCGGRFVSVLPISEGTLADGSYGLKYPLRDLALPLGYPRGVSNERIGDKAGFEIKSGMALVVLAKE